MARRSYVQVSSRWLVGVDGDRHVQLARHVPEDQFIYADQANAIFLEVKTPRGRLSTAQRACHSRLLACGVHLSTVRGIDDVRAFLTGLVTLRQPTPHARAIEQQLRQ